MAELTDTEIERVREICYLGTYGEAAELCALKLVNDAQKDTAKELVVEWNKVRMNVNDLIPNSQNEVYISRKAKRRLIRRTLRPMLGLPAIAPEEADEDAADAGSSGGGMQIGQVTFQTGRSFKR